LHLDLIPLFPPNNENLPRIRELAGITPLEAEVEHEMELQQPHMTHSPSFDKDLNQKYPSMFKKSTSVPLDLSAMADDDADLLTQYFFHPDAQKFIDKYRGTFCELLRDICDQPDDRQSLVSQLVLEWARLKRLQSSEIRSNMRELCEKFVDNLNGGKKLVKIYAQLTNEEAVTYDDFEFIFEPVFGFYREIIPTLFASLNELSGDWSNDLIESEFWREIRFVEGKNIVERIDRMDEWKVLQYFPQFEVAHEFACKLKRNIVSVENVLEENGMQVLMFEVLSCFEESKVVLVVDRLRSWFSPIMESVRELGSRFGSGGELVSKLLSDGK
jgi:hypothetical protein